MWLGDAWLVLAEALRAAGSDDEAAAALGEAIARYEAKGATSAIERARELFPGI